MIALHLEGTYKTGFLSSPKSFFMKFSKELSPHFRGMTLGGGMGEVEKGVYQIIIQAHPAAEPLRVTVLKGQIQVDAPTGAAGPGYHQFVCDALRGTGDKLGVTWNKAACKDSSNYFFSHERRGVEAMFLSFAGDSAAEILEKYHAGQRNLSFHLPTPDVFFHDKAVATVLGPRSEKWLTRVSEEPLTASDAFPWWDADVGANYFLGRALTLMWIYVKPRAPQTEDEAKYVADMLKSLEQAYKMAPRMRFPWKEWFFFMKLSNRPPDDDLYKFVEHKASEDQDRPLFGYRRGDYLAVFPSGWRMVLPADFAEKSDGEGWEGWDDKRTVQVGTIPMPDSMKGQSAENIVRGLPNIDPTGGMGENMDWARGVVASRANLHQANEGGRQYWRLGTVSVGPGTILNCTINFDEEKDKAWAINVWKSIDFKN